MKIKEGTLISYRSVSGYIALGVVDKIVDDYQIWAYWSDERDKETSWVGKHDILEAWEVINFEEETKMTNVNKHGVDYSAIEIGDLVKLDMGFDGTILGYVTYVDSHKLEAIWSDDFEEWHESFSTGKLCGHWKVVIHKDKPTKPYGQLVSYNSSVLGRKKWGLFSHMDGDDVWAYWEGWSNERVSLGTTHIRDILDIVDVVVHEPKKLVPTEPYAQLVAYDYFEDGSRKWGVFTHVEGETVFAYWCAHYPTWMPLDRIVAVEDIIIHEPKEKNLSAAQELSVQQESANFAHAAVQGIINAHAEKNKAKEVNVQVMLPRFYSHEEFKAYGEEQYMRGREDEHRENPQGLKTVEEYKKYGRDCYLQGQTDEINRGTSFNFSDFDSSVARTWKKQDFKDAVSNAALGITGEAGEVADLIKKAIYHGRGFSLKDNPKAIAKYDVKDELSDVLFYVSAMAQEFGFTLEDIAKHNREKLEKRFPEGFSTEASAQKKDKNSKIERKELKKGDKLIVTGDRKDNPLGWGVRHIIPLGTEVEFAWYDFEGNIVVRRPDGGVNTVHKDDLKEVKN